MSFYSSFNNVWEEEGTPRTNYDSVQGVLNANVVLRTLYAQRYEVFSDIVDNRRPWPHLPGAVRPPIAFSGSISQIGCNTTVNSEFHTYEHSLLTIQYSNAPRTGLIQEEIRPASSFLKLDHEALYWPDEDSVTASEAPGFYSTSFVIIRTINDLIPPIDNHYLDLIGTVNEKVFVLTTLNRSFAAETVLYSDPSITFQFRADGSERVKVVQRLIVRQGTEAKPATWNKYWRTKSQTFDEITRLVGGDVVKSYPPFDWDTSGIF